MYLSFIQYLYIITYNLIYQDLPPPPTDEELASISSTDITTSETSLLSEKVEVEPEPGWISTPDSTGRIYYFNTKTQTSQWDKPDELVSTIYNIHGG